MPLEINDNFIIDFYGKHKELDFEKINSYIIELLDEYFEYNDNPNKINTFLNKNKNNMIEKIKTTEIPLLINLNLIYPSLNPFKITENKSNYYIINNMNNNIKICFTEYTDYTNIDEKQVDEFIEILKQNKSSGVMISNNSGISSKKHFQIDIHNGFLIVYIHYSKFQKEKIEIAINMIENMYQKILELNYNTSDEIMSDINTELNIFNSTKEDLINSIKENQSKIINKINNFNFTNLDSLLSTKLNIKKEKLHKCNICNLYTSNTLKGMAAHKRGCKKKILNEELKIF
jgi:hypothetical protein